MKSGDGGGKNRISDDRGWCGWVKRVRSFVCFWLIFTREHI